MKRFLAILLILPCFLISCTITKIEQDEDTTEYDSSVVSEMITTKTEDNEADDTDPPLPCLIGFYDEITKKDTYTRLTEWRVPWVPGKDIAVFDIIPSYEESVTGKPYKDLWINESSKISKDILVKPWFILEYTLKDGTTKTAEIRNYSDAESVNNDEYLEVYLYDDIHQDGGWYYHLTKETTNEETVISSFKLTAGELIYSVETIKIFSYIEGSAPATVEIYNGNS